MSFLAACDAGFIDLFLKTFYNYSDNNSKGIKLMKEKYGNRTDIIEYIKPVRIVDEKNVTGSENLFSDRDLSVTFTINNMITLEGKGAYILLDFGKEMCGGVRIISRVSDPMPTKLRITFGESVTEALSSVGKQGATNDHSPRDFIVDIPLMSDQTFGQTGFRFVKIELPVDGRILLQSVRAVSRLAEFENCGFIATGDEKLDEILKVAEYTLRLCFQNGYIWDGIKRDRLVWSGDLNPEILSSLYLYGANENITNSLSFLRSDTPDGAWINAMPTYSAWWLINLCDYARISGDREYYDKNRDYALSILEHIDRCITGEGELRFESDGLKPFLDWPTFETPDAVIGSAAIFMMAAKYFLVHEDNAHASSIIEKLKNHFSSVPEKKQTRAFQILSGGNKEGGAEFIEAGGSRGMSTFMSYYILKADAECGGKMMIDMIKEYYGAMLERGATTFWEDFDLEWLEGSGRIDELPSSDKRDLHADYGNYCYKNLRHSLCHGWSTGIIAFVIEYIFGLRVEDGFKNVKLTPHPISDKKACASLPTPYGELIITLENGKVDVQKPDEITVEII